MLSVHSNQSVWCYFPLSLIGGATRYPRNRQSTAVRFECHDKKTDKTIVVIILFMQLCQMSKSFIIVLFHHMSETNGVTASVFGYAIQSQSAVNSKSIVAIQNMHFGTCSLYSLIVITAFQSAYSKCNDNEDLFNEGKPSTRSSVLDLLPR